MQADTAHIEDDLDLYEWHIAGHCGPACEAAGQQDRQEPSREIGRECRSLRRAQCPLLRPRRRPPTGPRPDGDVDKGKFPGRSRCSRSPTQDPAELGPSPSSGGLRIH